VGTGRKLNNGTVMHVKTTCNLRNKQYIRCLCFNLSQHFFTSIIIAWRFKNSKSRLWKIL